MPRSAFTLIESLVALTVLALVAGACLELRAGALAHTRTLAGRQDDQRRVKTVFDLALAGLLDAPQRVDPDDPHSALVWTGERDGEQYQLLREPVVVPNPLHAPPTGDESPQFPEQSLLFQYTLEIGGGVYTMEWTE